MPPYLSRAQVRLVDKIAIEEYGIPGIVLMENAARGVVDAVLLALEFLLEYLRQEPEKIKISVVCGGGNNGGDGYAIARHLHNRRFQIKVYALSEPSKLVGDAAINRHIAEKMDFECVNVLDETQLKAAALEWQSSKLIIDAILGTGFSGELRPHVAKAIKSINAASAVTRGPVVVSVDLPSGLDCDSGIPSNPTIRADWTVTFVAEKIGFDTPAAKEVLGHVEIAQIGAPIEIIDRVLKMEPQP